MTAQPQRETARLEHANLSVHDMDATVKFILTALPHFRIRGGDNSGRNEWVHVGTDATYICVNHSPKGESLKRHPYYDVGVNHFAFVVDDVDAVVARLEAAGYPEAPGAEVSEWRHRHYFHDPDGMQWEFVQYLTDDPAKYNHYD